MSSLTHEKASEFRAVWSKNPEQNTDCPLLLLLHGWGSNERDLPDVAEQINRLAGLDYPWVSLRAPEHLADSLGMMYRGGYGWFINPIEADPEEKARQNCQFISSFLKATEREGKAKSEQKVIPIGFSQGAVSALALGFWQDEFPELRERIEQVVALSGYLPFSGTSPEHQHLNSRKLKVFHGWGDADPVVEPHLSLAVDEYLNTNSEQFATTTKAYRGMQHSICIEEFHDVAQFLTS